MRGAKQDKIQKVVNLWLKQRGIDLTYSLSFQADYWYIQALTMPNGHIIRTQGNRIVCFDAHYIKYIKDFILGHLEQEITAIIP